MQKENPQKPEVFAKRWSLLFCLLSILAGCAASTHPEIEGKKTDLPTGSASASGLADGSAEAALPGPLSVELEELVNDGRVLHAAVRLTSRAQIRVSEVALRLSGFGAGAKVREVLRPLQDCVVGDFSTGREFLVPGEVVHAYLPLAVTDLSSYSLELLWGGEARQVLGSLSPTTSQASTLLSTPPPTVGSSLAASTSLVPNPPLDGSSRAALAPSMGIPSGGDKPLVFEEVGFLEPGCGRPEGRPLAVCLNDIKVIAQIANQGSRNVAGAEVALSLVPKALSSFGAQDSVSAQDAVSSATGLDLGGASPQNEALIQMRPLSLAPGARRAIRLVVPRSVYEAAWSAAAKQAALGNRAADSYGLEPRLRVRSVEVAE